jgi:iduronate 2-sulfatase
MGYTVRTKEFRYTEWKHNETGKILARELYDHRQDHNENVNVAEKEGFENHVTELSKVLNKGCYL